MHISPKKFLYQLISLRELTVQILLDVEPYRLLKNDAVFLQSSKTRRLKVEIISDASGDSNSNHRRAFRRF